MRLRAPLYGDHYLSQVFGTFELSKSLPEILHREGPVDHRLQLAGFKVSDILTGAGGRL